MKTVISTESGQVAEHFGRCPEFTVVEYADGKLIKEEVIANPGHHPGYLPAFFKEMQAGSIVCGGMGQRAKLLFDEAQIQTITGISGNIKEVIERLLKGELKVSDNVCTPGAGKGYGLDKTECDHENEEE
jgi:predicted Fe-Mo cluster-binding NifX family protein